MIFERVLHVCLRLWFRFNGRVIVGLDWIGSGMVDGVLTKLMMRE